MRNFLKYMLIIGCALIIAQPIIASDSSIERFAAMVDSIHRQIVFPHNVGPGIVLTNIGVDKKDKMLVINYTLNRELVESVVKNVSSENGIAQLLTGYDEIFSISMIEAKAGYRTIITSPSEDGLNKTEIVTVPASAIPVVYAKLKNGDYTSLKPYLEMLQTSFSNMRFPLKIVESISLINAFIRDKSANWVYRIEGDIDKSAITDAVIQNNRMNVLNNLRANISPDYVTEIEEQEISLHYTYLDKEGELLYEFIFTADDLR